MIAALRRAWWWVGAFMGDHDYARYVALHRRLHPERPPLSERDYWRERHTAAETNPGSRCC